MSLTDAERRELENRVTDSTELRRIRGLLARDYIDRLPSSVVNDLSPLASIEKQLHTGTNAFGGRISSAEREVLKRTKAALLRKLAEKYSDSSDFQAGTGEFLTRFNFHLREVKEELASRAEK